MCSLSCAALWCFLVYMAYKLLDCLIRLPHISKLDQRYYFITGCDTGFGNGIARKLDKMGCYVFAGCLTEKGETELKKVCSSKLQVLHVDVKTHDSIEKAFNFVKSKLPPGKGLDGVLNNAGILGACRIPTEWLQTKDYQWVLSVNLLGLIDVTTVFLPLVKLAHGRVVNTSSINGRLSWAGIAPYAISKFGVEAFSDALRREMRPFKVSVHIIEPGMFQTNVRNREIWIQHITECWNQIPDSVRKEYGQQFFDHLKSKIQSFEEVEPTFPEMTAVVDAYYNALTGMYPRARYIVGKDACYTFIPLTYLPEWLSDWYLERSR